MKQYRQSGLFILIFSWLMESSVMAQTPQGGRIGTDWRKSECRGCGSRSRSAARMDSGAKGCKCAI